MVLSKVACAVGAAMACVVTLHGAPARAQSSNEWTYCLNDSNAFTIDQQIDGCTAVIQAGRDFPETMAIAFRNRGDAYAAQHDWDHAIPDWDQAATLDAYNPVYEAADQAAGCSVRATADRDLDVARALCDAALRFTPNDEDTLASRGMVGLRQQRWRDAWSDYNAAARAWPPQATYFYGRGIAELRLGRTAEGQADLAHAAQLDANIAQTFAGYGIAP